VPPACSDRLSRLCSSLVLSVGVALAAHPAGAQITDEPTSPYPDPRLFARGWFAAAEVGAALPVGPARDAIHAGPLFGVRAGYEFARWVALQARVSGSSHSIELTGQPQVGQLWQVVQAVGELKLAVPLGAWSIFGQGGAGRARFSTNVLGTAGLTDPGVRVSLVYGGSLGVDYHSRSRHFSGGLVAGMDKLQRVTGAGLVTTALYLRYTF
jgi:hypothetical protein